MSKPPSPASAMIGCGCLLVLIGVMLPVVALFAIFIAAAMQTPNGSDTAKDQPAMESKMEPAK